MPAQLLVGTLLVALAGCSDPATSPPSAVPQAPSSPGSNTIDASPTTETLPVTWTREAEPWRVVLRIPYGSARNELGIDEFRDQAPIVPSSFEVTDEGFVIGDPAKNRVVVLNGSGALIREWTDLPQVLSDLAIHQPSGRVIVITNEYKREVTALLPDGVRLSATLQQTPVALSSSPDGVGVILKDRQGGETDASLDEDLGLVTSPIGFPAVEGTYVAEHSLSQDGELHRVESTAGWARDFLLEGTSRPTLAVSTFDSDLHASAGKLYFAMRIGSFGDYPGADLPLHLLIVDAASGEVDSFEKVSMCSLPDTTNQYGFIGVQGTDVYQLCLGKAAAEIRKRTH